MAARSSWLHVLGLVLAAGAPVTAQAHGTTERVSLAADGSQLPYGSASPLLSADGRFVAFTTLTIDLLPDGGIAATNVFVRDRRAGTTERATVGVGGALPDSDSTGCGLSGNGRFVAFSSTATNLVPGDTNGRADIFVRDRTTSTTELVSVGVGGVPANGRSAEVCAISANGRFVAFNSDATNLVAGGTGSGALYVRDRRLQTTERVGGGKLPVTQAWGLSLSADGRFVAFGGDAGLVAGNDTHQLDVFVYDRRQRRLELASLASDGTFGDASSLWPSISSDGQYVSFHSDASDLVPGDTNHTTDIFVRDRQRARTQRVSVGSNGAQGNNASYGLSQISANGRYVASQSFATNLVANDTNGTWDAFVRDRRSGKTRRVSVASNGAQANGSSPSSSITADGRTVAFYSQADNLVPNDTNGVIDAFVRKVRP